MPNKFINPAVAAFVATLQTTVLVGQVLVKRLETGGYELRHERDNEIPADALTLGTVDDAPRIAAATATGRFRPLKSAPNLKSGWRIIADDDSALGDALDRLYPGFLPDWYGCQRGAAERTSFRELTARQTGMYRITQKLDDEQVRVVVEGGCAQEVCLKQRLWEAPGLEPDKGSEKSVIPCLEPCPLLLEFARKSMRMEQEEPLPLNIGASAVETLIQALEGWASEPAREADFNDPANSRRKLSLLAKLRRIRASSLATTAGRE